MPRALHLPAELLGEEGREDLAGTRTKRGLSMCWVAHGSRGHVCAVTLGGGIGPRPRGSAPLFCLSRAWNLRAVTF